MMKAFQVNDGDGHSVVVFARHNVTARRQGANELNIEFESIDSCRRKPEFDCYSERGSVPVDVLIEHGWWFECHNCYETVTADSEDRVFNGDAVYCSQSCQDAEARRLQREALTKRALHRYVARRYPGTEVMGTHVYTGGYRYASVSFRFPGSIGTAHLTVRGYKRQNGRDIQHPELTVELRDHQAWNDYLDSISERKAVA